MNNMLYDFSGKKFVVTGASSGIGRSTAICLANQGAQVVLMARDTVQLEETKAVMTGSGHQIISADLGEMVDMTELFNLMVEDGKKLDGLVHCAGVSQVLPLNGLRRNKIEECMKINFYAFVELVRLYAKKKYNNKGGSVVAISSIAACQPEKCQTAYAASKGALNAAVQSLAFELADKHIRINSIMPGFVNTRMIEEKTDFLNDKVRESKARQILGIIEPEEIANVVSFLLSEASGAITGRSMYADGGCL